MPIPVNATGIFTLTDFDLLGEIKKFTGPDLYVKTRAVGSLSKPPTSPSVHLIASMV